MSPRHNPDRRKSLLAGASARPLIARSGRRTLFQFTSVPAILLGVALGVASLARTQELLGTSGSIVPIDASACDDMKVHHVLSPQPRVGCDRLKLVKFAYVDFDGRLHADGEVVVMDAAAKHVLSLFNSLRRLHFPIAKAVLMNRYDGNDNASMDDNNTSAFNDREITSGGLPSLHAYGLAIDVNPIQNPYVTRSGATLTFNPASGVEYANRLNDRPGKKNREGMAESAVETFAENGFLIWGGYWDDPIDYQHFQVERKFAERLAQLAPAKAEAAFDKLVERYRRCRRAATQGAGHDRTHCVAAADQMIE